MKTILFFIVTCCLQANAVTISLLQNDSVHYNWLSVNKVIHGHSAMIEVKGKKFQIGVFDISNKGNDSIHKYGLIAVYKLDEGKRTTFFDKFDLANRAYVDEVNYLILENEMYRLKDINLDHFTITKMPERNPEILTWSNYLDCIYDIGYFDGKYTDSIHQPVPASALFKQNKLNVIYYTMDHCPPCEKLKPGMVRLSENNKINLSMVMEIGKNYDQAYTGISQKYFYDREHYKNNFGYPVLFLFDGKGNFIRSLQDAPDILIANVYSYANEYK
jgi:hypothetical protein